MWSHPTCKCWTVQVLGPSWPGSLLLCETTTCSLWGTDPYDHQECKHFLPYKGRMEPFPKVNRSIDTKRGTYVQTNLYLITFLNQAPLGQWMLTRLSQFRWKHSQSLLQVTSTAVVLFVLNYLLKGVYQYTPIYWYSYIYQYTYLPIYSYVLKGLYQWSNLRSLVLCGS